MSDLITLALITWGNLNGGLCWSVTNYWPPDGGHNCMEPCNQTGAGHVIDFERDEWAIAAAPLPYLNSVFVFPDGSEVKALDTFGNPVYQAGPFYHDGYGRWVIPLDILTDTPLHYLECAGELRP